MKYIASFLIVTACGAIAADTAVDEKKSREKNLEILAEEMNDTYRAPLTSIGNPVPAPVRSKGAIPALILPNNVCVIDTDLSPNRTIEEHIAACVVAHRMRQSLIP